MLPVLPSFCEPFPALPLPPGSLPLEQPTCAPAIAVAQAAPRASAVRRTSFLTRSIDMV